MKFAASKTYGMILVYMEFLPTGMANNATQEYVQLMTVVGVQMRFLQTNDDFILAFEVVIPEYPEAEGVPWALSLALVSQHQERSG